MAFGAREDSGRKGPAVTLCAAPSARTAAHHGPSSARISQISAGMASPAPSNLADMLTLVQMREGWSRDGE